MRLSKRKMLLLNWCLKRRRPFTVYDPPEHCGDYCRPGMYQALMSLVKGGFLQIAGTKRVMDKGNPRILFKVNEKNERFDPDVPRVHMKEFHESMEYMKDSMNVITCHGRDVGVYVPIDKFKEMQEA